MLQCPSDRSNLYIPPGGVPDGEGVNNETRGNYAANWGNTQWDQGAGQLPNTTLTLALAIPDAGHGSRGLGSTC